MGDTAPASASADADARFAATKSMFTLPKEMVAYMDGNSLGPLPAAALARLSSTVTREWGTMLISSWNKAGWMAQPNALGDRIARLIGAAPGTVTVGDTLSIRVYQCLAAALRMRPGRKVVLSDSGNFPSDLYMASGLIELLDDAHELRLVPPEALESSVDETVAVVMCTEVDYRTGRLHDVKRLVEAAHARGALAIVDLAHTAGACEVDVAGAGADFAVGCTYKYLNAGPGAPAFIYVAPEHLGTAPTALQGWLGHAKPFEFSLEYAPAEGISRFRVGTPPVLQMACLEAALDVFDAAPPMAAVRRRSVELSEQFIGGVEARCPMLTLASPRDPEERGSQVSFRFEEAYAVVQALIARGVVGDFRAPDMMRFGFTPLYLDAGDVGRAVDVLAEVMEKRLWDQEHLKRKSFVT